MSAVALVLSSMSMGEQYLQFCADWSSSLPRKTWSLFVLYGEYCFIHLVLWSHFVIFTNLSRGVKKLLCVFHQLVKLQWCRQTKQVSFGLSLPKLNFALVPICHYAWVVVKMFSLKISFTGNNNFSLSNNSITEGDFRMASKRFWGYGFIAYSKYII